MSLLNSKREFTTQVQDVNGIMDYCTDHFEAKGFTVNTEETASGGFISLTKGGIFRSISGMKTGLNITITRKPGAIEASMDVGIFGKQLLPSAISMLVFWPVLIPQIVGLVQQSSLDKEAYQIIGDAIHHLENSNSGRMIGSFCPFCGKSVEPDSVFCPNCGGKLSENKDCPNCGFELPSGTVFCPKCGTKVG